MITCMTIDQMQDDLASAKKHLFAAGALLDQTEQELEMAAASLRDLDRESNNDPSTIIFSSRVDTARLIELLESLQRSHGRVVNNLAKLGI